MKLNFDEQEKKHWNNFWNEKNNECNDMMTNTNIFTIWWKVNNFIINIFADFPVKWRDIYT